MALSRRPQWIVNETFLVAKFKMCHGSLPHCFLQYRSKDKIPASTVFIRKEGYFLPPEPSECEFHRPRNRRWLPPSLAVASARCRYDVTFVTAQASTLLADSAMSSSERSTQAAFFSAMIQAARLT